MDDRNEKLERVAQYTATLAQADNLTADEMRGCVEMVVAHCEASVTKDMNGVSLSPEARQEMIDFIYRRACEIVGYDVERSKPRYTVYGNVIAVDFKRKK